MRGSLIEYESEHLTYEMKLNIVVNDCGHPHMAIDIQYTFVVKV